MKKNNLEHLYIHLPFCKSKCHFCDFVSCQNHEKFILDYHDALLKEIKKFAQDFECKKNVIKTIFIGGGTPSLYPLHLFEELFSILNEHFNLKKIEEATIEVNPQGVTKDHLKRWKKLGINRLSIGVQILNDEILKKLNRSQCNKDVFDLIDLVPSYFNNFSIDLILGLPGTTTDMWKNTLKTILSWPLKHVSVYSLMVYNKTPLFFQCQNKSVILPDEKEMVGLYEWTVSFLQDNGFEQYEISNFAKPGFESIHNKAYWDRKPYKGLGLSASSFDGYSRFVNDKNLFRYIKNCNEKDGHVDQKQETLTPDQVLLEILMLGLRQKKGVDLHDVLYFLKGDKKKKFLNGIKDLENNSLIANRGGKLSLTLKGMMLENEVILSLI